MATRGNATISDIARRAEVSISTVSRVLSGTTKVTDAKRRAVLEAVTDLNYQPNVFARGLASGQSLTIGVLTQNFGSPFYDGIIQGVVRGLNRTDYFPIFADGQWRSDIELEAILAMMRRQIDGLIVIGGFLVPEELEKLARDIPLVIVARRLAGFEENCVCIDNVQASYVATQHLIELGHRRIAHISGRLDHPDARDRQQGYIMAIEEAGIQPNPELIIEGNFRRQSGVLAIDMLLLRGVAFSAIFAANDQMAHGARLGLYRRGLRVPEDLSLVGFDDDSAAAFMIPPLTTVRQPAVELGHEASRIILARLKGETTSPARLKSELIVRESTSIHR
ncbi:MAG TPA: substrate-binding domain-containing protein [Anaerolineae bacterium]|nr:substrate-binding domain-containing protein [Anaerolineae bacterium]